MPLLSPLPLTLNQAIARSLTCALLLVGGQALPAWGASAAEMHDLSANHWAYRAIRELMERYGIMEGFPDATFKGNQPVTRYELAAALVKVMARMEQIEIQKSLGNTPFKGSTPAVSPADKAAVLKLQTEFKTELDALQTQLQKDEGSLTDIQTKLSKLVSLDGDFQTIYADDFLDAGKDRTAPFIGTTLNLKLAGKLSDATTFDAAVGGAVKANGSGDIPAVMSGALGATPSSDNVLVKSARLTTKIGSTTLNVGRFPLWLVGFGPNSTLPFRTGDFIVGVGDLSQDVSNLRVGSDVGATLSSTLGPITIQGGLNSNIIISQLSFTLGDLTLQGGYETDQKAITQNILGSGPLIKTTDNAAVVLDYAALGPIGVSLQANLTNEALTQYGAGIRTKIRDLDLNATTIFFSDPGKSVTVMSYGLIAGLPGYPLPWASLSTPAVLMGLLDNYTFQAPARADGKPTTGPGGEGLGKSAGFTLQLGLDNPIIPNLVFEYNAEAALIEDIFLGAATDPSTSESILFKSTVKF
jgi:hypothetical protein